MIVFVLAEGSTSCNRQLARNLWQPSDMLASSYAGKLAPDIQKPLQLSGLPRKHTIIRPRICPCAFGPL